MIRPLTGLALLVAASAAQARGPVERVYATLPGWTAMDRDDRGGNPFASALIDTLDAPGGDLAERLLRGTLDHSDGQQGADIDALPDGAVLLPQPGETAVALVIVFADYGDDEGLVSLPGAAFDAARVGEALMRVGFATHLVVARSKAQYRAELATFALASAGADRALLYTTGHGVESGGIVYLVPPEMDGPALAQGRAQAIPLGDVERALQARRANWLFYAGCRDNPLKW